MYKFNHILVSLDHSDIDEELIEAASFLSGISETNKITFLNVIKDVSIPEEVIKEFPNLIANALLERKKEIEGIVDQYFDNKKAQIVLEILSGPPTKVIMKYCDDQSVDLIMVGRKNEKRNGGVLINRLARRSSCSLLIIPRGYKRRIDKILVPIDFSDYATGAMRRAIDMAQKNLPDVKIFAQNVFHVPTGYHYTGKSYSEFAAIMRENAEKDYEIFMKKIETNGITVEPIYTLNEDDGIIDSIFKAATKHRVDAIVIGAKGRTAATALLIGSSAERVIQRSTHIPLLVVRPKGPQAGIIDYLKEI